MEGGFFMSEVKTEQWGWGGAGGGNWAFIIFLIFILIIFGVSWVWGCGI